MLRRLLTLALLVLAVAGCDSLRPAETMTVLAGSELKDLEPLLEDIRRETGVELRLTYIGTLDGAERLLAGESYDLAWFSHGKYLTLLEGTRGRVAASEKIMLSPVVLGVKRSRAQAYGWLGNDQLTWRDIADRAAAGELKFAMTSPTASNSGFTALLGVAAAFSGAGDALDLKDVDGVALKGFFRGQALTAGSSGWLAEAYVREQERLDGIVNYESVLMQLNAGGQLREPLELIYPREGIITADYPLMLLDKNRREAYDRLVGYLKSPKMQRALMERTQRRPVIPEVRPNAAFPDRLLVELPFPSSREVVDGVLIAYLDEQRIPAHAVFVLDVSGSMEGDGIAGLKAALDSLTGTDRSLTGQFARFRSRERVTLITFNHAVQDVRAFDITSAASESPAMRELRGYAAALKPSGGTAVYDALARAYALVQEAQAVDPDRYYSVVLLSDGVSNRGLSVDQFEALYRSLPAPARQVKTFPVLFAQADDAAMRRLAEQTGGRVFDGRQGSLAGVFKQIRGYQ